MDYIVFDESWLFGSGYRRAESRRCAVPDSRPTDNLRKCIYLGSSVRDIIKEKVRD